MFNGGNGVWNAVRHIRVKLEGEIIGFIGTRETNTVRSRRTTADDIEVEAVQINLDLTLERSLLELLHVSVQSNELGSQDIVAWFDVAGQLEFKAVAIVRSKFISPSICSAHQYTANRLNEFPLILPAEGINPDSKILKNFYLKI